MKKVRHPVAALLLFSVMVTLCITIYSGLEDNYGVVKTDTRTVDGVELSIMDQLQNINIIGGFDVLIDAVYTIVQPKGIIDILGGLASAANGVLKVALGLITFPFEIMFIITAYYSIPPILPIAISLLIVIYLGFILISAYLGGEV